MPKKDMCLFVHDTVFTQVKHCVGVLGLLGQTISNNYA